MGNMKTGVAAGLAFLASLYADASVTAQTVSDVSEKSNEMLSQLGFGQTQGEEHLYLANIRQRTTSEITDQFEGKSAMEIETLAQNLGYEVEWVNA